MKKLSIMLIMLFFLALIVSYTTKPAVTVYNNTAHTVFLYRSTGEKNVDPDIEQAKEARRRIILNSGNYKSFVLPWRDLMLKDGQFYQGWEIVTGPNFVSQRHGGLILDISASTGVCSYKVFIENEIDRVKELNRLFCFGKLKTAVN